MMFGREKVMKKDPAGAQVARRIGDRLSAVAEATAVHTGGVA